MSGSQWVEFDPSVYRYQNTVDPAATNGQLLAEFLNELESAGKVVTELKEISGPRGSVFLIRAEIKSAIMDLVQK
jgi:hypothetical protein